MGVGQVKRHIGVAPAENMRNAEAIADNSRVIPCCRGQRRTAVKPAESVFIGAEKAEKTYSREQQTNDDHAQDHPEIPAKSESVIEHVCLRRNVIRRSRTKLARKKLSLGREGLAG